MATEALGSFQERLKVTGHRRRGQAQETGAEALHIVGSGGSWTEETLPYTMGVGVSGQHPSSSP